jgi:glutaredoxin
MSTASTPTLSVYLAPDCHLCHQALTVLRELREELRFELEEHDITLDDALHRAYLERIPVVSINGEELFEYFVDPDILRKRLGAEHPSQGPGWRL